MLASAPVPIIGLMEGRELHLVSEDLADDWLDGFVRAGLDEISTYLAKHAAFQTFLEDRD
jgi:hypothetical protein